MMATVRMEHRPPIPTGAPDSVEVDPLDIAYLALGARMALIDWQSRPRTQFPFEGELDYLQACIDHAPALQRCWDAVKDEFGWVWCYDVVEPFGMALGHHLLDGGSSESADRLLRDIVTACLRSTHA